MSISFWIRNNGSWRIIDDLESYYCNLKHDFIRMNWFYGNIYQKIHGIIPILIQNVVRLLYQEDQYQTGIDINNILLFSHPHSLQSILYGSNPFISNSNWCWKVILEIVEKDT